MTATLDDVTKKSKREPRRPEGPSKSNWGMTVDTATTKRYELGKIAERHQLLIRRGGATVSHKRWTHANAVCVPQWGAASSAILRPRRGEGQMK
jgi:hypothetical protein